MIEKLTVEKLKEYGFSESDIERIMTGNNHEAKLINNLGNFVASNIEAKIYSGTEAWEKDYFKDKNNVQFPYNDFNLIDEYYKLKQISYLATQKKIAGNIFGEKEEINQFKQNEIDETNEIIKELKAGMMSPSKKKSIEKYNIYLKWLHRLDKLTLSVKNKSRGKEQRISYSWTGKQQNKTVLHKLMKGVFIDKETNVKDFCSIFENVDIAKINPVKWIGSPTELLQLLYEMMEHGLIKDERKRMSWLKLNDCFCKADGSHFTEALRSIFEQIKKYYTTEKTAIKDLIKSVK